MSIHITTAFVQDYKRGIDLLVQQKDGSRLRGRVRTETVNGKNAFFDQIGATAAIERTTRHSDTPIVNTPHSRRRVTLKDFEWADLIDDPDKVKVLNDPTNAYSMNAAAAMNRAIDDQIIAAALGNADTNETGSLSVSLATDGGTTIAAGGTGLTVAKLRQTKRILDAAENDPNERRFLACSAQQIDDLFGQTEITSADFNTVRALAMGEVNSFMGFEFVRTQRLSAAVATVRDCFAWRESALLLAIGKDSTGRITERADKSYSTQVFYAMTVGATRMEGAGVVGIACQE